MTSTSDPDPLKDALTGVTRAAERDLDEKSTEDDKMTGELMEGAYELNYMLMAPGYTRRDISVRADEEHLVIEAYDFKIVKYLRCVIEPATVRSTYLNGVLSVRVAKRI